MLRITPHGIGLRTLTSVTLAILSCSSLAATPAVGDRVDNFELLDHKGASHELFYHANARVVVLMASAAACNNMAGAAEEFSKAEVAHGESARFFMLDSTARQTRQRLATFARAHEIKAPILHDDSQLIGESLGVTRAGEVLIIDTEHWTLKYRGAATGLAGTVGAVIAGVTPEVRQAAATCDLAFPEKQNKVAHAGISYTDDIAPILLENCVTCHREGGIGPWAMKNYNMVRGFAPMIREVVRTQRMPPWHADPEHGEFANDRSLTREEKQTLVHWIEAGAPRDTGADPLLSQRTDWPEWGLGAPDVVINIPPYDVPASGVVEYQYPTVTNPLDHAVWVRGTELIPGDRQALHHVITRFVMPRKEGERRARGGGLGGYVPGAVAREYPDNTGTLLPAGATISFQMHYTPYGKASTDKSRFGIYLHDSPPAHNRAGSVLMNTKIRIPANVSDHTEFKSQVLDRDVLLYSLLPHSHYRGVASDFVATYPDGREEILLSVPSYDFNWQTTYQLKTPKRLPAGTKIVHSTTWDNSAQNPANPDPSKEVRWGRQSWNEMLFGAVSFRYVAAEDADDASGADQFAGAGSENNSAEDSSPAED
jgi:hypothetical protein